MIQKTKKRVLYILGVMFVGLVGGVMHSNFNKDEALFVGVNIAHADLPLDGNGNIDTGGCDGGCSGCDSF